MSIKILMIAAEPSADKLGAYLIDGIRHELGNDKEIIFQGIGGPLMKNRGLVSFFNFENLAIMGVIELIPKILFILKIINKMTKYALAWKPDLIITIDSPDFSLKISKKVKAVWPEVKTVHYVAPSVWAWRGGRAKKMTQFIDHVLAILPFEPAYMHEAGISCDFVGHPIVSELAPTNQEIRLFRGSLNIERETPIVSILPGSRKSEIARMLPILIKMIKLVSDKFPNLVFIIPSTRNVSYLVSRYIKNINLPIIQIREEEDSIKFESDKKTLFSTSLAAVATSGTVSLELARMGAPMVIGYRASVFTEILLKMFVRLNSATLINILTSRTDVTELLFSKCTYQNLSIALITLLTDRNHVDRQRISVNNAMISLGAGGLDPKVRAAQSVLKQLNFY